MKYACVTGADRGLGFELVKQLLGEDYTVFAGRYAHSPADLPRFLDELEHEHLIRVELDVSSDQSVRAAAGVIQSHTKTLNLLVNCAAVLGKIEATVAQPLDFDDIRQTFNVNAVGPLRVTNALFPLLLNSPEKLIVNISSEAGSLATCSRKSWYGYCMSKAALNMESMILHNYFQELGGQVLVLHPGWMRTWMNGKLGTEAPLSPGEAAGHLLKLILNAETYRGVKPAFLDYQGEPMTW